MMKVEYYRKKMETCGHEVTLVLTGGYALQETMGEQVDEVK